jgi:prepilin-type processing-associated H-X9-DG protein
MSCINNQKQLGTAVQLYVADFDDQFLFKYATSPPPTSRLGASTIVPSAQANGYRWWNLLMPYVSNGAVLTCPDDDSPTMSDNSAGQAIYARSFIACRPAEGLTLGQITDPAETIVITEKWGTATDSWLEPFNGDFSFNTGPYNGTTNPNGYKAANIHTNGINCTFFDGHAKWMQPAAIMVSEELTGCGLVHQYPVVGVSATSDMCDNTVPGCLNTNPNNICNTFTYS